MSKWQEWSKQRDEHDKAYGNKTARINALNSDGRETVRLTIPKDSIAIWFEHQGPQHGFIGSFSVSLADLENAIRTMKGA